MEARDFQPSKLYICNDPSDLIQSLYIPRSALVQRANDRNPAKLNAMRVCYDQVPSLVSNLR
jgi:hypothetical protein